MGSEATILWLIGQSVVIVGAVVAAHVATKVAIAKLEAHSTNTLGRLQDLKQDHKTLSVKVDGISRQVAKMEATQATFPYIKSVSD